jgi:hypothetical protein
MSDSLNLTPDEIFELTGMTRPADQVRRLHVLGFWLSWRNMNSGRCILPRAHYMAVCSGARRAEMHNNAQSTSPKVKAPAFNKHPN